MRRFKTFGIIYVICTVRSTVSVIEPDFALSLVPINFHQTTCAIMRFSHWHPIEMRWYFYKHLYILNSISSPVARESGFRIFIAWREQENGLFSAAFVRLQFTWMRYSGSRPQHVNKTSDQRRQSHLPLGLVFRPASLISPGYKQTVLCGKISFLYFSF